jgi:hypothetical protein
MRASHPTVFGEGLGRAWQGIAHMHQVTRFAQALCHAAAHGAKTDDTDMGGWGCVHLGIL